MKSLLGGGFEKSIRLFVRHGLVQCEQRLDKYAIGHEKVRLSSRKLNLQLGCIPGDNGCPEILLESLYNALWADMKQVHLFTIGAEQHHRREKFPLSFI